MPYVTQKLLGDLLYDQVVRKPYLRGSIVPTRRPYMSYGRTRSTRFRGSVVPSKKGKEVATKAYVKKAIQSEDIGTEVTAINTTYGTGQLIDYRIGKNIDKGTDSGDRKGKNIFLKKFRIFGSMSYSGIGATPSNCHARILIVHDKTPLRLPTEAFFSTISDSNTPVDFVEDPNPNPTVTPINIVRPLNPDRYTVLYDLHYVLGDKGTNGEGLNPAVKVFDEVFTLNKKLVYTPEYNTAGSGITPCLKLLMFFIRDTGTVSATAVDMQWQLEEHFSG